MRDWMYPAAVLLCVLLLFGFGCFTGGRLYEQRQQIKQREATTPDAYGIIHHPKYGNYPAEVPYHHGMTLKPGQTARGVFLFNRNEKGN